MEGMGEKKGKVKEKGSERERIGREGKGRKGREWKEKGKG